MKNKRPPIQPGGLLLRWLLLSMMVAGPARMKVGAQEDNVHVMPPWIIAETGAKHGLTASSDYFASALGPSSVITAIDWSGRGITTLAEALRQTPGVMLQESFGGFEPPRLSIRGSGLDSAPTSRGVALLIDGLPLARADGAFHSGLFDPQLFPRIEIYRGTLHMALTPAVLGGVINAVSLTPSVPGGNLLRTDGGSYGVLRAQLGTTSPGGLPMQAEVSTQQADGWREHSAQRRTALKLAAHQPLSPTTQLEVSAYAASVDYDVPGPLTLSEARASPRSVIAAVPRDQPRRHSSVIHTAAQLKSHTPGGDLAVGLAWLQLHDDFYQLQANGETDLDDRTLSGHVTYSQHLNLGPITHHILTRLTCTTGNDQVDRYLNVSGQRGARFGAYQTQADTAALSIEDVVWLRPTLALGTGFTALHGKRQATGRNPSPMLQSSLDFEDFSPRGALLWSPDNRFSFHAAISRSIEPPTFDDLIGVQGAYPNLSLTPRSLLAQSAVTYEVGVRGTHGSFDWNITAYHAAWRHEILRLADASGLPRGAVNADRTRHEGLESSLRWHWSQGSHRGSLGVTSTLGHFQFDDDPVYGNNRLAGAPPHTGNVELSYAHARGFLATITTDWVAGRIPVDHANRMDYEGHSLTHVRLGWRPGDRVLVYVNVRNIFDRQHIASTAGVLDLARNPTATTIFLPGVGRSFTLGLELKL
ncbi:MAG: TonB-dependent receptor [Cephaloticoccus sp.]|nr:TonB-dependent receptor [Cephaloticoccus sp.]MCF7759254.1 TonB-dependent receptor [Cephaloticoccus sp.]